MHITIAAFTVRCFVELQVALLFLQVDALGFGHIPNDKVVNQLVQGEVHGTELDVVHVLATQFVNELDMPAAILH